LDLKELLGNAPKFIHTLYEDVVADPFQKVISVFNGVVL
jgi:hypothetical protein